MDVAWCGTSKTLDHHHDKHRSDVYLTSMDRVDMVAGSMVKVV